jgi:hypothetical protein
VSVLRWVRRHLLCKALDNACQYKYSYVYTWDQVLLKAYNRKIWNANCDKACGSLPFTWGQKQFQVMKRCFLYPLEYRTMDKVQKPSNFECYIQSSKPFSAYFNCRSVLQKTMTLKSNWWKDSHVGCWDKQLNKLKQPFFSLWCLTLYSNYVTSLLSFCQTCLYTVDSHMSPKMFSCCELISKKRGTAIPVKRSWRHIGLQDVEAPTFLQTSNL